MSENKRLEFHLGTFGKLVPLLVAVVFIIWAAVKGSNVSGYMVAFFMAIIFGVILVKDEKAWPSSPGSQSPCSPSSPWPSSWPPSPAS